MKLLSAALFQINASPRNGGGVSWRSLAHEPQRKTIAAA
jgi:hypothetical protein